MAYSSIQKTTRHAIDCTTLFTTGQHIFQAHGLLLAPEHPHFLPLTNHVAAHGELLMCNQCASRDVVPFVVNPSARPANTS